MKLTNEEKAQRLEYDSGWKEKIAHIAAQDDGNGKERSAELLIDAAIIREAAAMMRERGQPGWMASFEREHKGRTLTITEARPGRWHWYVDAFPDYSANLADSLEAAQAAAVAWVDEQEGQ